MRRARLYTPEMVGAGRTAEVIGSGCFLQCRRMVAGCWIRPKEVCKNCIMFGPPAQLRAGLYFAVQAWIAEGEQTQWPIRDSRGERRGRGGYWRGQWRGRRV